MLPKAIPSPLVEAAAETLRPAAWFPVELNLECPLLEAMPFPKGVSSYLEETQRLVAVAVDVGQTFDVRAKALQEISLELKYYGMSEAEILRFRLVLISQIKGAAKSAQLIYAQIQLNLEENDCRLLTATSQFGQPCSPFIEYKNVKTKPLHLPATSIRLSEELLIYFAGKNLLELRSLGAMECTACIVVLALYLQHGMQESIYDSKPAEKFITLRAMQSLWHLLLKAIPDNFKAEMRDFSVLYGQQAFLMVMHRISLYSSGCKTKTGTPNDIDGRETNTGVPARLLGHCFHIVVPGDIPPASDSDARDIIQRLSNLKHPLPVARLPTTDALRAIQNKLLGEFPWAADAIHAVLDELVTRRLFGAVELTFTPLLLLGPPGVGKTRLVRRLAEEVAMPFMSLSLAAMEDSHSLLGTSRGWTSAQPAPLIEFLSARKSASALMLLDEVDKVTHRTTNSTTPTIALLSFLEPENARNFFDTFLQTRVDLSKVNFVATANSVDGIPGPLLSRMRLCVVGRPSAAHMASTIASAAADVANDWGLNPDVFPPISLVDLDAVPINMRHLKLLLKKHLAQWAAGHLQRAQLH